MAAADVALAEAGEDFRGVTDWQDAAAAAIAAGSPLSGLPQGLRIRPSAAPGPRAVVGADVAGGHAAGAAGKDGEDERKRRPCNNLLAKLPVKDFGMLLLFLAATVIVALHIVLRRQAEAASRSAANAGAAGCHQCEQRWWDDFWRWRLAETEAAASPEGANKQQAPPAGMEWEWAHTNNHTDWFAASAELVDSVVIAHAPPGSGPTLHVGCGDSPVPELLHRAGFREVENIDIAPQVIEVMQRRYPADKWPGLSFAVRDFLGPRLHGGGPPPPAHRFTAVVDKAGIWDWLQDEADYHIPRLLDSVREALVLGGEVKGRYFLVTKQAPMEFSDTLAKAQAQFLVRTTRKMQSSAHAWAYVLEPL